MNDAVADSLEEAIAGIQKHVDDVRNSNWTTFYGFENEHRDIVASKVDVLQKIHPMNTSLVADASAGLFVTHVHNNNTGDTVMVFCTSKNVASALAEETGLRIRIFNCKMTDTEMYLGNG